MRPDDNVQRVRRIPWWAWVVIGLGAVALGPVTLLATIVWAFVYFTRHRDAPTRANFLKIVAVIISGVPASLFAVFVVGEALTDPGGWKGAGLVASWAVPAAVLAWAGWTRPYRSAIVFEVLAGVVILLNLWDTADRSGWRTFENHNGPVLTIATFVVLGTTLFFAWKRPTLGGSLMLGTAVASLVIGAMSRGGSSVAGVGAAFGLLPGLLFVVSGTYDQRDSPPPKSRPKLSSGSGITSSIA